MTTVLTNDLALMCAADLQDLIEFLADRYERETNKREKRTIYNEYDAAINYYNATYKKTYNKLPR
jgi:hypothetical protein